MQIETNKVHAEVKFQTGPSSWTPFFTSTLQLAECRIDKDEFWFGKIEVACKLRDLLFQA